MKKLMKIFIGIFIIILLLLLILKLTIYFTIGKNGKIAPLNINGYGDVIDVIKTTKGDAPKIKEETKPTKTNKESLILDIKNASGTEILTDDLYLGLFATGKTIILPTKNIKASGGEIAYLYTWILDNLENNEIINAVYDDIDYEFNIESMEFISNDGLNISIIISVPKSYILKQIDGKAKFVLDKIIKNDNVYAKLEYKAIMNDDKIIDGKDCKISINDKTAKQSEKVVEIIHYYIGNIENDIISYNNKILNNLGRLTYKDNDIIIK